MNSINMKRAVSICNLKVTLYKLWIFKPETHFSILKCVSDILFMIYANNRASKNFQTHFV